MMKARTNPNRASASVKAMPRNIVVRATPAASGWRAMADLQARVGELAIELAEKVVERSLDRETNMQLIENYINQVGSAR